MDINLHRCQSIEVIRHMPANSNSITLSVVSQVWSDGKFVSLDNDITLFGLPSEVTDALIEKFAAPGLIRAATPELEAA